MELEIFHISDPFDDQLAEHTLDILSEDVFLSELGESTRLNRFIFLLCRYLIPAMLILTVAAELFAGTQFTSFTFVHSGRHISSLIQAEGVALFTFLVLLACTVTGWTRRDWKSPLRTDSCMTN